MKKRKLNEESESIYTNPALESTLLIETGGVEDVNSIGQLPSSNLSAALSSGTRVFQYNRYFWNKEAFTFNYSNNAVGVAIAYYRKATDTTYFAILPIFLPRICMTAFQSLSSGPSPTSSPKTREFLMRELVYYLNLGFTGLGVGNNYGPIGMGPGFGVNYRFAPWVTASDAKGSPYDPDGGYMVNAIINNPFFPIFQNSPNPLTVPPLLWTYSGNNGQLCLRWNPAFPNFQAAYGDAIGFNIHILEDYMADAPQVSDPDSPYLTGFSPAGQYYQSRIPGQMNINLCPDASYGTGNGWCCKGVFTTGFGQATNFTSQLSSQSDMAGYSDIYTSVERKSLWNATRFPCVSSNAPPYLGYNTFIQLCKTHQLTTNAFGSGILLSRFITGLIPFRFFCIESDSLTRNQKRPMVSNNPSMSYNTMAVQFMTLDNLRTWTDNTLGGQGGGVSMTAGSRKSGADDCAVVSLDPMQSLQTLDLILRDEWGNILQNYHQLQNYSTVGDGMVMGAFDGFYVVPGLLTPIPPWCTAYDPIGAPNQESILINENWWASVFQFFGKNPQSLIPNPVGVDFSPSHPRSTTITHFGRVVGY